MTTLTAAAPLFLSSALAASPTYELPESLRLPPIEYSLSTTELTGPNDLTASVASFAPGEFLAQPVLGSTDSSGVPFDAPTIVITPGTPVLKPAPQPVPAEDPVKKAEEIRRERMTDGDLDWAGISVAYEVGQGGDGFHNLISINYFGNAPGNEYFKMGMYGRLWFATAGAESSITPPWFGYNPADNEYGYPGVFTWPGGLSLGMYMRAGGEISYGDPELYPSIGAGLGFDPLRIFAGTGQGVVTPSGFLPVGFFLGFFNGVMVGFEGHVDAGINFGPFGIRGGIYPSVLLGLNPGVRLEGTF